jgi:hypothetical protein
MNCSMLSHAGYVPMNKSVKTGGWVSMEPAVSPHRVLSNKVAKPYKTTLSEHSVNINYFALTLQS